MSARRLLNALRPTFTKTTLMTCGPPALRRLLRDSMTLDLSIVVVNYNTRQLLLACLESIYASADRDNLTDLIECIVIDNNSSDDSLDAVRKAFPQVSLIANQGNRYFSAAYTQGIELASGRYILALNPDTEVQGRTL